MTIRTESVQRNAANTICNAKIINNNIQHEVIKEVGKSYYWSYLAGAGGLLVVVIAIYIIWFYRCVTKNVHTVHTKIFLVIFFVRMIYAIMMNLDGVPPTSLSLPLTFNEPILFIYDCLVVSFLENAFQNVEE